MKKMKKLTSMLLALTMSLILAVPCFAAESDVTTEVYDLGTGTGLDCDIVTNISAINSSSVDYNYWHLQGN